VRLLSRGPNVLERLAFLQHAPEITVLLSTADRGRAVEGCLSHDEIAAARLGSCVRSPQQSRPSRPRSASLIPERRLPSAPEALLNGWNVGASGRVTCPSDALRAAA
jgi:hypothetical protein